MINNFEKLMKVDVKMGPWMMSQPVRKVDMNKAQWINLEDQFSHESANSHNKALNDEIINSLSEVVTNQESGNYFHNQADKQDDHLPTGSLISVVGDSAGYSLDTINDILG